MIIPLGLTKALKGATKSASFNEAVEGAFKALDASKAEKARLGANRAVDAVFYRAKSEDDEKADRTAKKNSREEVRKQLGLEKTPTLKRGVGASAMKPEGRKADADEYSPMSPVDKELLDPEVGRLRQRVTEEEMAELDRESPRPKAPKADSDEYSPMSGVDADALDVDIPVMGGGLMPPARSGEKGTGKLLTPVRSRSFAEATDSAPSARVVADDEVVQSFFAKTHGGPFDPKSRVDRAKMDKILGMVNADPKLLSMSPGKFAMKVYTSK